MAETTKNYGLVTPSVDEFYDVGVHNGNMERLDRALQGLEAGKADLDSPVFTGRVRVPQPSEVPADDEAATVKFVKENGQGVASSVEISEDARAATGAAEDNVDAALVSVGNSMAGKKVEGLTLKTAVDTETGETIEEVAKTGAEIFNDYREREFSSSIATAGNAAIGKYSHAEGRATTAIGDQSHTEGWRTRATGHRSHAEGSGTAASGSASHAEGSQTNATGDYSHAEGYGTTASGNYSHAEGNITEASGQWSHVEGLRTKATAYGAHAEGWDTVASGGRSHAEGQSTQAKGQYSHAEGYCTISASDSQHVQGEHNIEDAEDKYAHIVGNGTSADARSNAHTLDWDGNAWFAGEVTVGAEKKPLVTEESLQTVLPSPTESGTILYSTGEGVRRNIPFLIGEPKGISDFAVKKRDGGINASTKLMLFGDDLDDHSLTPKIILNNGVTISEGGKFGNAMMFDGNAHYISIGDSSLNLGINDFCIDFWVKPLDTNANRIIFSKAKSGDVTHAYFMYLNKDGALFTAYTNNGEINLRATFKTQLNELTHFEVSRTKDTVFLFVNGIKACEQAASGKNITNSDFPLLVGFHKGSQSAFSFYGLVSDFRINIGTGGHIQDFIPSAKKYNQFSSFNLTWTNPTDLLIPQTVHIRRSSGACPATLEDGVEVYSGSDESCLDESADLSTDQYYTAWVDNSMVQKTDESMKVKYSHGVDYLMLYDHGDECVDVTGGWVEYDHVGNTYSWSKNSDCIEASAYHYGTWSDISFGTNLSTDFISYGGLYTIFDSNRPNTYCDIFQYYRKDKTLTGPLDNKLMNPNPKVISICETDITQLEGGRYVSFRNTGANGGTHISHIYAVWLARTDDYIPWLRAGNLSPSDYPTLDSLLADETAMGVLMNSSAAVDRMIQYTGTVMAGVTNSTVAMTALDRSSYALSKAMKNPDWYKFMMMSPVAQEVLDASAVKVPVMTSDTMPSGQVVYDSQYNSSVQTWYRAFDQDDNTYGASFNTPSPHYIGYKFEKDVSVYKVAYRSANGPGSGIPKYMKLQYSDDGSNWTDVTDLTGKNDNETQEFLVPVIDSHVYWRLYQLSSYSTDSQREQLSFFTLQFYGKELINI